MSPLLTIKQAAEALTLSPWTVRAWIREGKLPVVRLGRRIAVERAALESVIAAGRSAPPPAQAVSRAAA